MTMNGITWKLTKYPLQRRVILSHFSSFKISFIVSDKDNNDFNSSSSEMEFVESGDTSQILNDKVCYNLISDYINLIQSFIFRSYHSYHPSLCQFLVYI